LRGKNRETEREMGKVDEECERMEKNEDKEINLKKTKKTREKLEKN